MKRALIALGLLLSGASLASVWAQSNDLIDALLAEPAASYGKASWLALSGAGHVKPEATPAEALGTLAEKSWTLEGRAAEAPVTTGEYAFLLMRAFGLKGGLMYRLLPGPRYATRQLSYAKLLGPKAAPGDPLSGEQAARLVSELVERKGGRS